MSGQKQSFRFRLPWLPSLVSAPIPPGRSSTSKRNRKTAPPPPPPPSSEDSMGLNMIPVQRHVEQLEGESPAHAIEPLTQLDHHTPLPKTDLESHLPPQLNHQQLTEAARVRLKFDSQSPFGKLEAATLEEPTEFHIHLSGTDTDSTEMQLSNLSSDLAQAPPNLATRTPGTQSQHLPKTKSQSPTATVTQPPTQTRESKPLSPSQGAKLRLKSHSSSSSSAALQKPSPIRANSQPRSPSHTGTLTRAISKHLSPNAGNHPRSTSTAKQPSASHVASHPQITSLPPVPYRTVKSNERLSKSHSSTSSKSSSSSSSPSSLSSASSSSSSFESPLRSSFLQSSSSYLTGESSNPSNKQLALTSTPKNTPHAQTMKPKTNASRERKSTLPQEETTQSDATKSTELEAIQTNESNAPVTDYDKMAPKTSQALKKKEVNETKLTEHPSIEEDSDTEEGESHWSARNKRKRKLFLKRVSARKNILLADGSHKGEVQSNIPWHHEIKKDVSNFIEKLSLGKQSPSKRGDRPVSIITISGKNKGASLHLNGKAPSRMTPVNSDTNNGAKRADPWAKHEHQARGAYINSNIQSINNSMLLSSSVHERNPGVHFGTTGENGKSAELNRKEAASSSDAAQVKVTTAGKLEYKPIVKRRCLRGLLMESSESEAENPNKPRRHGCRVACIDKEKHDF